MFRPMRRFRQALSEEETRSILQNGSYGVLAVAGDGGYPYAVPLNYVYADGKIYIHCARTGHKLDAIAASDKASFCVVEKSDVWAEKLTTLFRSAIVFGRARLVTDDTEKRQSALKLAEKYSSCLSLERREQEVEREWDALAVIALTPEHISGKQAIELLKK